MYVRDVSATRYRWVVLAAGTLAQASFSASSVGLPALSPTLKSDYGLSLTETGVVLAAVGIGMLFTLLPWGLVADRVDERWVIATGLTGAAALLVVASTTDGFASVTAALVGVGALGASVNAASGRAIMAWFPSTELGLALGIRQTAIPIGGAVGAAAPPRPRLGRRHAPRVRLPRRRVRRWERSSPRPSSAGDRSPEPEIGDVTQPLRDRFMWLLGRGTGGFLLAQIGIIAFVVLFLHEHRNMSKEAAGAVLAAIYVLAVAARIGSGTISDRLGSRLVPLRTIGVALALLHRVRRRRRRRAARAPDPALRRRRRAEHVVERARLRRGRRGRRIGTHGRRARLPADAARRRRRGGSAGDRGRRRPQLAARVLPRRGRPRRRRPDPAAVARAR